MCLRAFFERNARYLKRVSQRFDVHVRVYVLADLSRWCTFTPICLTISKIRSVCNGDKHAVMYNNTSAASLFIVSCTQQLQCTCNVSVVVPSCVCVCVCMLCVCVCMDACKLFPHCVCVLIMVAAITQPPELSWGMLRIFMTQSSCVMFCVMIHPSVSCFLSVSVCSGHAVM